MCSNHDVLGPTFPSPSLSDSLEEAIGTVEKRGERNDVDSGAFGRDLFGYVG